ncbi:hypothetical protein [Plebeiibacterium marinum]|uniref:Uncharacterized protein n=1 Tax=Plebeiibacterium marinum TaxID=2992111 RepID=A0AAE3SKV3_9BACT|nr:hypothetical protein [Plebeiobacterium marinum]MCW3806918.1 hypothetical protein [Plebeiobacterium marinum]
MAKNFLFAITISALLSSFSAGNSQIIKDEKKITTEIKPGKKKATLILSDGRRIELEANRDTILQSNVSGINIKIDSTGINYIECTQKPENKKTLSPSSPLSKKKRVNLN